MGSIPDYIGKHFATRGFVDTLIRARPPVMCADGTGFSVQAGAYVYSSPPTVEGPHTSFEVVPILSDGTYDYDNLWGWCPRDTLNQMIHEAGGLIEVDA